MYFDKAQNLGIRQRLGDPNASFVIFGSDADDTGSNKIGGGDSIDHLYGGGGNDWLEGRGGDDYLEGNAGDDRLEGGTGNDVLVGGIGSDELLGGDGRDRLEGGAGNDRYFLTTTDTAIDTIVDSDNSGRLWVGTTQIIGFNAVADGVYDSYDGFYRMAVLDAGNSKFNAVLSVKATAHTLAIIENVQRNNVLGYTLPVPPGPLQPDASYLRGAHSDVFRVRYQQGGSLSQLAPRTGLADGGAANDFIEGGRFANMDVRGGAGNDVLVDVKLQNAAAEAGQTIRMSGGTGSDFLYGAGGTMYLDGGDDNDFISSARFGSALELKLFARDTSGALVEVLGYTPSMIADMGNLLSLTHATVGGAAGAYDSALQRWSFFHRPFAASTVVAAGNLLGDAGGTYYMTTRRNSSGALEFIGPNFLNEPGAARVTQYATTWTTNPQDPLAAANVVVSRSDGLTANAVIAHLHSLSTPPATMVRDGTDNSAELAYINAGAGNDLVFGGAGVDIVTGGAGDDRIDGAGGEDILEGGAGNDFIVGGRFNDYPDGGIGDDILHGGGESDTLYGGEGNDTLIGDLYITPSGTGYQELEPAGADFLDGGDGDDFLDGGGGADILQGGAGNDVLQGGRGDDYLADKSSTSSEIYDYKRGDGSDIIFDGGGFDRIRFGPGISQADLTLTKAGKDLRITVAGSGDLLVRNALDGVNASGWIELFQFAGGSTIDARTLSIRTVGTDAPDRLNGSNGADTLEGGAGDDVLEGLGGNDVFVGGAGADVLSDSSTTSADIYVFNRGNGADTVRDAGGFDSLKLGTGITAADVSVTRVGAGLQLYLGQSDRVTIENVYVGGYAPGGIEQIIFSDNSTLDLTELAVQFAATEGNDFIVGTERPNIISALGGDDIVEAMGGNDTISGGTGNDQLWGGSGSDVIDGGPGDDRVGGGASNDTGRSPDVVGSDTVLFGRGDGRDSVYFTKYGTDVIRFKAGILPADAFITATPSSSFFLGIRNSSDGMHVALRGSGEEDLGVEEIRFVDSPGTVWRAAEIKAALRVATDGDDYILGFSENDALHGGNGNDRIDAGSGNDSVYGDAGNDYLYGEAGNDFLYGGAGDDYLELNDAGNDWYEGGAGNDNIYNSSGTSSAGADTYVFGRGDGQDVITGSGYLNDGEIDTLLFKSGIAPSDVAISQFGIAGITIKISGTTDSIRVNQSLRGFNNGLLDEIRFVDNPSTVLRLPEIRSLSLVPSAGDDFIWGFEGNETITGEAGDDFLAGGAGDDILDGGVGNDTLRGGDYPENHSFYGRGLGNDTYRFGLGDGNDSIEDWDTTVGNRDTLLFKSGVTPGSIRLQYQFGGLRLLVGGAGDSVGLSLQDAGVAYEIEEIRFTDAPGTVWTPADLRSRIFRGSYLNETFNGTTANDYLFGDGGDDVLNGLAGDDVMDGGYGSDRIDGGDGNDLIDTGPGGSTSEYVTGGRGNDTISSYGNGEVLSFARGDGQDVVNTYRAGAATVGTLHLTNALAGEVTLVRGVDEQSNDLIVRINGETDQITVSDYFVNSGGLRSHGISHIRFSDLSQWTRNTIDANTSGGSTPTVPTEGNDTLRGTTGNDTIDALGGDDTVYGDAGNDTLLGGAGNDQLYGETGDDTLIGGVGSDTTVGGPGNDIHVVDTASDLVVEAASEGLDTVQSPISWTLGANIENVTLTGTSAINATGNTLNNTLVGNSAANRVDGGAGADSMQGGGGNDTYVVDNAGDVVTEAASAGTDTVESSVSFTLSANVENIVLTGTELAPFV